MAENGFQFRWSDHEDEEIEQDLERIPRPLWHNLLDLGLIVLTLGAEITVGRVWPQRIVFNVWSYVLMAFVAMLAVYLLLDRFFPEGLRSYLVFVLILSALVGRAGRVYHSMKRLRVLPPWIFTAFLALLCVLSIPIAYFSSDTKVVFFIGNILLFLTFAAILLIRITGRQRHDRKAQERQELLEQQKREEMGRWK